MKIIKFIGASFLFNKPFSLMLIKYAEEKLSKVYKHSFIDFCKGFDSISDIAFT